MFGWFKPKSEENKETSTDKVDVSGFSDAKQKLLEQMREKRAEIGEEELQKMANALKMDKLKKQMHHDIDNDEDKLNRLLDEIRGGLGKN